MVMVKETGWGIDMKNMKSEMPIGRFEDKLYCADGTIYFFPRCVCVDYADKHTDDSFVLTTLAELKEM